MKNFIIVFILFFSALAFESNAQDEQRTSEKYGQTLNLGVGVGYYGYLGHSLPVVTLNYEFDVAKNLTLAPFVGVYTNRNSYYWGSKDYPYRYYSYSERVIPLGVKGTYYFDQLLGLNSKWDIYAAGSLGFVLRSVSWENGYYGSRYEYSNVSPLYLDIHVGTEYHLSPKAGIFLDLSTGVSTAGLAVHF